MAQDSTTINNNMPVKQAYSADQIQVLEGLEPVRKRPGMYIGSTGIEGLQHLITEIVNNSMDEAIAGYANHIKVELFEDNSVAIYDNGRGIPYGIKKEYGVSALELAYTRLHAGGKFGQGGYKVSSGLHGVGASVTNALSSWCRVLVIGSELCGGQSGEYVMQEYEKGGSKIHPLAKVDKEKIVSQIKEATKIPNLKEWTYGHGTIVQFKPDSTIFETTTFNYKFFLTQLKEYAFLTGGVKFELTDHISNQHHVFYFEGGIRAFLRSLNRNKLHINPTVFHVKKEIDNIAVEVAMQYNDSFNETELCFANHLKNSEGGTHLTGFRSALTRSINDYARKNNLLKEKDPNITNDDLHEGLTAIISVKLDSASLQFEGQTKTKLGNTNVRQVVETIVRDGLDRFFEENPKDANAIIEKNILALKARIAAKAARDTVIRKSVLEGGGVLPGKLADCASKDPKESELFIVEGDSAAGPAKQARDRDTQAILPIFGKILNTERARLDKIVSSEKLKPLIIAIGAGIGEYFDPTKLRYHKLIIMSDADTDGAHIRSEYLTMFFRHFPDLISKGYVYAAVPPLYKAIWGKEKKYIFDDIEREKFLQTPEGKRSIIQRFKGLGEMNEDELWETTMDPKTRRLKQITIDDAAYADEIFTMLMGEEVAPRKRFIQTHAKQATLDIT